MYHNQRQFSATDLTFKHPATIMVSGPTGSGKTVFIRNLLQEFNFHFNLKKIRILWCYGVWQQLYNEPIKNDDLSISYKAGLPSDIESIKEYDLLIADDLMSELGSNTDFSNIFTRYSHHLKISVVFITQNLFSKGKESRTISLNSQYFILLKNRRDLNQIMVLGRQLFHRNSKAFNQAYEDIMKKPYGYLLVDTRADTPEFLRLRTSILAIESLPRYRHLNLPTPIIYNIS